MTVTAFPSRNEYTAVNGQTVFNYTFLIFKNTDLNVYLTQVGQEADDAADLRTNYTVDPGTIGNPDGGFITFNTGLAVGELVTIVSNMPEDRTTDYQNSGDFRPDTVNADFDRTLALVKQQDDRSSRTLAFEESRQNSSSLKMSNPDAGLYLRWRTDESGVENASVPAVLIAQNDFATINDLKNAAAGTADGEIEIGDFITILDYGIGHKSGVLFFKIVAGGTGTDDKGTFIDLTTSGFQAQQNFPGFRSIKQFSGVGDGTILGGGTNDNTAVKNSYAAAKAALVPWVIDSGNFRYTEQLDADAQVDIRGAGRLQSNLIKDGAFDGIKLSDFDGAHYSDFAVLGASGNTGLAIDIFVGHRITMNNVRIREMGGGGIVMRGGNQAGFHDLKVTLCGGTGFEINSNTGFTGASANSGTYTNLDLNGSDINFKITAGAINKCGLIVCQNAVTMNAQLVDASDVERNQVLLYTEFEGTSVSDIGGTANDVTIIQGEVTDSGTFNRILDFNQAGLERPLYRELYVANLLIHDRDADPANAQSWNIFEAGTSLLRILRIQSNGSSARPAVIEISQPAGNVCDIELNGKMTANGFIPTTVAIRSTTDTSPTVDGANTLISTITGAPGSISDLDDGLVGQKVDILAEQAAGTLTIVDGTIELTGGVDFVMNPGDTLVLKKFRIGTWRELSRSVR